VVTASPQHFQATGPEGLRTLRTFVHAIRNDIGDTYDLLIGEDDSESRRTRAEVPTDRKIWRTYTVEHIANVTGDMIQSADVQIKQDTNQPYVSLSFKTDGSRAFAQVTTDNVHKRFAIVLDERVMSAPVINEPIRNGSASITLGSGDYRSQMAEANELMVVLRAGALPAPLSEGTMDFIGPTLGRDTIRSALIAAAIGIGLVMLFMAIWYGSSGMIANAAVVLNLMIQLAAISLIGATLTLPGFAGLALTVGMAVDSNVLINERIREELRAGKSVRAAVDAGYEHAFTAIFDGHVTTFISGVVLLQYGTGPIKGFAVMLLVGIVANLFTGVFATRVVFDWLVRGLRVKKLSLG
ncbi:MAG: protein translocase subunit SecD, partial [Deltaproteobacteria bacterium]